LIVGCGTDAQMRTVAQVRDSAGIAIVENTLDSAGLAGWRIPDSAVADIGGEDAGPGMLQRVRLAVWDGPGNIIVGDGVTFELRRFDSAGRHIGTWGGQGDGPGEFRGIGAIWPVPPDSLRVWDFVLRRLTVLASSGEAAATTNFRSLQFAYTVQPLGPGRLLFGFLPMDTSSATSGPTTRSSLTLAAGDVDSVLLDTILVLPAFETYPVLGREGDATYPGRASPIFGKGTIVRTNGSRILVASNDAFEIAEYDSAGTLRRIMRLASPPREVKDADHAAYVAQELQAIDDFNPGAPDAFREQWRSALRERRVATHFPFIDDLIVADDGSIWVEAFRWQRDEPRRYLIFDAAGQLRARAEAPLRSRPTAIRGDRVLALWRDADDIEHVRIYPIRR
jgi:hypothetical protein